MTARQIILKCLDENTDIICRKRSCDLPEKEGNTGKCCHKCSLEILDEHDNKMKEVIRRWVIDEFLKEIEFFMQTNSRPIEFEDALKIAKKLGEQKE